VVQLYISRPFLVDDFKFDLRVYVLVTSCDPLRVYVYRDGLGRFATIPYREPTHHNLEETCRHLTNYSINKNSQDFIRDDVSGSKRRLSTVNQWFSDNGYNTGKIWAAVDDVIIKTLVAAHPVLRHNYRSCFPSHTHGSACFEILGFDILLDHKLKAWLLEVNHSPSFHTDSPLDKEVKEGLLSDTFHLLDLRATDRRRCMEEDKRRVQQRLLTRHRTKEESCMEEEERVRSVLRSQAYEERHMGGFRRIYPVREGEDDTYCRFFEQTSSLCAETAASKARMELARLQRQGIEEKAKEEERRKTRLGGRGERREKGEEMGEVQVEEQRVGVRRRVPFRLTSDKQTAGAEESRKTEQPATAEETRETLEYEVIDEEEERGRLAGLQVREQLVRNLDLHETLSFLLASPQSPSPLPTSTLAPLRRHSSTHHCSHVTQSTPKPLLSLHSRPFVTKSGPPFRCWQGSLDPLEAFGLVVTAAPVTSRHHPTHRP
jgi:tubulin polyglutamylase TTLL6/13